MHQPRPGDRGPEKDSKELEAILVVPFSFLRRLCSPRDDAFLFHRASFVRAGAGCQTRGSLSHRPLLAHQRSVAWPLAKLRSAPGAPALHPPAAASRLGLSGWFSAHLSAARLRVGDIGKPIAWFAA